MLKPFIISPPFGNYLWKPWATSVQGSFTAMPRRGLIWNTLKTLRKVEGGWRNKIGLRNPGIIDTAAAGKLHNCKLISFAALDAADWLVAWGAIPEHHMVELNLGCPNVEAETPLLPFEPFVKKFPLVTAKLPPTELSIPLMEYCYEAGIRHFHLCNTYPTPQGGISGEPLQSYALARVRYARKNFQDITIIGGGGIYTPDDVKRFQDAGADHFSLSTVFFTPWKVEALLETI